jgi:sugar lactone lactonase YvrE
MAHRTFAAALLGVSLLAPAASAQIIVSVAGGNPGDGGPALAASFVWPQVPVRGPDGALYVADAFNNRVRRIDPVTGTITTVAGNGLGAFAGDGGPATAASLNQPYGIAFAPDGRLAIADNLNNVIREVDTKGVIRTIAGSPGVAGFSDGPALTAELDSPFALVYDGNGAIYFSDVSNNRIRKWTRNAGGTTMTVKTVAGNGPSGTSLTAPNYAGDGVPATSAPLAGARGVAVHGGVLYIADTFNHRVRYIDAAGNIQTFAGDGTGLRDPFALPCTVPLPTTSATPRDIAFDASGSLLLSEPGFRSRLGRFDPSTGLVSTIAGSFLGFNGDEPTDGACALVFTPSGLEVEPTGEIIFVDSYNARVRQIDPTGTVATLAGGGAGDGGPCGQGSFNQPLSIAFDAAGNLYVADAFNNRVRKITPSGAVTTIAGNGLASFEAGAGDGGAAVDAPIFAPSGLALDATSNLFIADFIGQVRRVDAATGKLSTVDGPLDPKLGLGTLTFAQVVGGAVGLAFDAKGNLYVADNGYSVIWKRSAKTGVFSVLVGDATLAGGGPLSVPNAVAVDAAGNVYIADTGNARALKFDTTGRITTIVNGSSSGGVSYPTQIAVDAKGRVYFDAPGEIDRVTLGSAPVAIAGNGVLGFTGDGGPATSAEIGGAGGLAFDAHGNVFFSDAITVREIVYDTTNPLTIASRVLATLGTGGALATIGASLEAAQDAAAAGNKALEKTDLTNFLAEVKAAEGKGITVPQGEELRALARAALAGL